MSTAKPAPTPFQYFPLEKEITMNNIKKVAAQAVTQTVSVLLSPDEIELLARAIEHRSADKPRSTPASDWEEAKRRADELRTMA